MGIQSRIKYAVKILLKGTTESKPQESELAKVKTSAEYWTAYNVTCHQEFKTREESLEYMRWRFDQYPNYEALMPCKGFDDKVILDYGCGPGHDVVGFAEYSKPKKIIAMDVSSSSLDETKKRIALHNATAFTEVKLIKEKEKLPIEDNSIDYIHSSGVLHHTPNMPEILNEFRRILKPNGIIRIMVYNHDSIWTQLYVPYILQIQQNVYKGLSLDEAFKRSTDGEFCPISNNYTPQAYLEICSKSGLTGKFLGAAISLDEMDWLLERNKAMKDLQLAEAHRNFLKELTFDNQLRPLYRGNVAGIDAVFELTKQ
jgi:ubiquinone/menaquinone biosynthesis C-methylase UbiE